MLSRTRFLSHHEINAYTTSPLKFQLGMHLLHIKSEMSQGMSERIMSLNRCWSSGYSFLEIKTEIRSPLTGCCKDLKQREKKLCILHLYKLCRKFSRKIQWEDCMLTGAKEGKKWSLCLNQGQNWNLICFSFFLFFFLHLMQFGSLRSHKYILTLCFELINFPDKRVMLYERSMSHFHYFQLSPNCKISKCVKANPFSGFICFLSQRQATWACASHPTTLTISSSMGHTDWKIQD